MKLILSINRTGTIGDKGTLPWHCTEDLKWFKEKTMGSKLLVGRTTFDTLPPLPGRDLIIVGTGHLSLSEALALKPDWVIGGKSIYEQTIDLCDEFYISIIEDHTKGDTIFDLQKIWSSIYRTKTNKKIEVRYFSPNIVTP
jgi:dihydrofolate reductase